MANEFDKFLKLLNSATGLMVKKKGLGENLDVAKVREGVQKLQTRCEALAARLNEITQLQEKLAEAEKRCQELNAEVEKVRSETPKKVNRRVWHYLSQDCAMPPVGEPVMVLIADMREFADGMERGDKVIDFKTGVRDSTYLGDGEWSNIPPMAIVAAWQNFSSIPPVEKIEPYILAQFEAQLENLADVKSFLRENDMAFTRKNNKEIYRRVERIKKNFARYKANQPEEKKAAKIAADLLKPQFFSVTKSNS